MNHSCPIVELHFPLEGKTLPSDHGYPLFSAISRVMPEAHEAEWLGIHTVRGIKQAPGTIRVSRFAKLRLRLPAEKVPFAYALAGESLNVGGHHLRCGIPELRTLKSGSRLRARTVLIKTAGSSGPIEPAVFLNAVQKQLKSMNIEAEVGLEQNLLADNTVSFARRTLKLKDTTLVGYTVLLDKLSEADSIEVQMRGIGGRRRMGCGLFLPLKHSE